MITEIELLTPEPIWIMLVQITRSLKESHKHIPDAVLLVALVLLRVDHHHLIIIIARLADHHARNAGEKRILDVRNQQPDRIGTICA